MRDIRPRILVIRAGAVGDTLMATPTLAALRQRYPETPIDFLCAEAAAPLLELNRNVDQIFPLKRRNLPYLISFEKRSYARRMRRLRYKFAVVLESAERYYDFVSRAGIGPVRGFRETAVDPHLHSIVNNLRAAGFEDWQSRRLDLNFPVSPVDQRAARDLLGGFPQPWIGLHVGYGPRPGSDHQGPHLRGWAAENFIHLGRTLIRRGMNLVLVGAVDPKESEKVAAGLAGPALLNLVGRTSIRQLGALIARLRLFISVDSGPAHIAAAVGTPLVVLWGPAILEQSRPLATTSPVRIVRHPVYCAPCFHTRLTRTCRRNICMERVSVEDVLEAVDDLLGQQRPIPSSIVHGQFSISIVIPSFNGRDLLEKYLPSVKGATQCYQRSSGRQTEIIVVEDGGNDGTAGWIAANHPDIQFVQLQANLGFPRACNEGFRRCRFPLVMLLNNDVRPEEDFLVPLARHFDDPTIFAVTCKSYEDSGNVLNHAGKAAYFRRGHWSVFNNYESEHSGERLVSAVATGGFSIFDRIKLGQLGGFDDLYSPYQYEDFDLSYRAWKRDWAILYEPASVVHHGVHSTIDRHYTSRQDTIISRRNRLLVHWKNLHDGRLFFEHMLFVALKTAAALFTLDTIFLSSLAGALRRLPRALERRRREKPAATVSDSHLRLFFRLFLQRPGIKVYWGRKEMPRVTSDE